MNKIIIYFNSTLPHFIQIFAGLEYLKDKGEIEIEYRLELDKYPVNIMKMTYKGLSVFFDLADSSDINNQIYAEADLYVKRMLLHSDFITKRKLFPFGLNYLVFYRNKFLRRAFLKDKRLLRYSMRFSETASGILNVRGCIKNNSIQRMHSGPAEKKQILFRTRLWDPDNNSVEWKKEERIRLSQERININRLLKNKYGQSFKGGIERDKYSSEQCPDILLSKNEYHKKAFVNLLKQSSIGIVNRGLEDSIGWKFGEYLAHSMGVVTNPINKYKLLGPLVTGEHYLVYETESQCIEQVDLLYSKDNLRREMQMANKDYYNRYLHPGLKLKHILNSL